MTAFDPVVVVASLLVVVLSLLVVAQCYRGYARNGSRPLLFLGLGIALVTLPTPLFTAASVAVGVPPYVDVVVLAQVLGLCALVYAFTRA